MTTFRYVAIDRQGVECSGCVDAADRRLAATAVRDRALMVVKLEQEPSASPAAAPPVTLSPGTSSRSSARSHLAPSSWWPVRTSDRVFLLRHLSLMLRSGLTLLAGLESARSHATKRGLALALQRVAASVESGSTFSVALGRERHLFPAFVVHLVAASEATGELDVVLQRAAEHLERQAEFRVKLATSLTYPLVVLLVSLATAGFLVWKIIPEFAGFLARRQSALPWSTQMLVDVSAVLTRWGPALLAAFGVALTALLLARGTRRGRLALDRTWLSIPIAGHMSMCGAMAEAGWSLALLLRSGVTVLDGLRLVSSMQTNRYLAGVFDGAAERVLRGATLADGLAVKQVPLLVPQVVSVGERTGSLAEVLSDLGRFYEEQVSAAVRRMSSLVEPVLILVVGGMVGFVYFAFFQAILRIAAH